MRINADRHRKPVQIERKTKRRRHLSTGQSFDQKSVFNSVEASKGNIFAKVVETNPLRVTAMTFLNCAKTHQVFDVILRNVETANKATFTNFPANPKSHFQRTIDDAGGTYEARLNVGDIVELQSVMTNYAEDTLLPWNYKLIRACDENPLSKLLLPETPCSFIPHQRYNAETESKETTYSLAIAMKGEAVKVDSIVDNFPLLRSFIGLDDTMKKGFLIRGRKSKNSKEYHGFSCYVTDADIEEGLTQNQILMNFFKSTSHHFINGAFSQKFYDFAISHQKKREIKIAAVKQKQIDKVIFEKENPNFAERLKKHPNLLYRIFGWFLYSAILVVSAIGAGIAWLIAMLAAG